MNEAIKQAQGAAAPVYQDTGTGKDDAGTGDMIVLAAFLGVFLLVCLMGILGFISKLWH
jgi:hypothetical protein